MPNTLTQDILFRQAIVSYAIKFGVTKAAIKYAKTKQYVSFWKCRYDGTMISLQKRSHRPYYHPNQHTEQEIKLIRDNRRRCPDEGLIEFWVRLRNKGYTRTIAGLYRKMVKLGYFANKKVKKRPKSKPMEQMKFAGERIQIDVKVVPRKCIIAKEEEKWYQYTAIDEFSRIRYIKAYKEHNTYSSTQFLISAINYYKKEHKIKIKCVQTDNGFEFTNRFSKGNRESLFEKALREIGIRHKLIRPFTPRHNGKVERSHREDQKRFYNKKSFYSFEDYDKQLRIHLSKSNNRPMRPLQYMSPLQYLQQTKGKL